MSNEYELNGFTNISNEELIDTEGGSLMLAVAIIGAAAGVYYTVREVVKDMGRAAAYRDLGY